MTGSTPFFGGLALGLGLGLEEWRRKLFRSGGQVEADSGEGVLGEGSALGRGPIKGRGSLPPPHQLEGLGERCKLPQRGSGGAPTANAF